MYGRYKVSNTSNIKCHSVTTERSSEKWRHCCMNRTLYPLSFNNRFQNKLVFHIVIMGKNTGISAQDFNIGTVSVPLIRSRYKIESAKAFAKGSLIESIHYDCMALDCGLRIRKERAVPKHSIDGTTILSNIQKCDKNTSLYDMIKVGLTDVALPQYKPSASQGRSDSSTDLVNKCAQLPVEWTVLQLSTIESPFLPYATRKDHYTRDTQIRLTILCSQHIDGYHNEPLVITLQLNEPADDNILSLAYVVYQEMYKNYVAEVDRLGYNTFITQLTKQHTKLIKDMQQWLGPWLTLFAGNVRGTQGQQFESTLFARIRNFCTDNQIQLNGEQMKLACLIGRRMDLVKTAGIKQAASYIGQTPAEVRAIEKLLIYVKTKIKLPAFEYYPCILVIDELLDSMPWEMVIPKQEFSRINSIYLLYDLYEKHKENIRDGYLQYSFTNGCSIINPDNDANLQQMHKRMMKFFGAHLNDWKIIDNRKPTIDELTEMYSNHSVLSYSGHGSSLQFFDALDLGHIRTKSIVLLFGCESIAMKSEGLISMANGAPYLLYSMGCPGMLGALTVVTDIWSDLITIYIVSQWLAPNIDASDEFADIHDVWTKERAKDIFSRTAYKKEPNLLRLLCNIRDEQRVLSVRVRAAIIFRGLPVINCSL